MRIDDLKRELGVVADFAGAYLSNPAHFPGRKEADVEHDCAYACELVRRAEHVFALALSGDGRDERKECEDCVKELLQFSRALALTTAEYHNLLRVSNYEHDYLASVAALKRVATAVRLHFLLLDLKAIVEE